jgi:hypothetical protein
MPIPISIIASQLRRAEREREQVHALTVPVIALTGTVFLNSKSCVTAGHILGKTDHYIKL